MPMDKLYHSREDRIADLHPEEDRVDFSDADRDAEKIEEAALTLDEHINSLEEALAIYSAELSAEIDEDSAAAMSYARRDMIEKWAMAQAALSKVGYVLRFDGNAAFQRIINALKDGQEVDMRGL